MINISIIDDENIQTKLLSALTSKWAESNNVVVSVKTFPSAESFLFEWSENKDHDIILLDIQMNGMNGMDLAKEIRKQDENLSIIFITGHKEYIDEGYDVSALHYLMKPVIEEKLFSCLDKACSVIKKDKPFVILENTDGETIRVLQSEIIYVEAFARIVFIQTNKIGIEAKISISGLESRLQTKLFIRCHRSYLVGLEYISKIGKTDLILDNGRYIPISRRSYNDVNQAFISFYRKEVE